MVKFKTALEALDAIRNAPTAQDAEAIFAAQDDDIKAQLRRAVHALMGEQRK